MNTTITEISRFLTKYLQFENLHDKRQTEGETSKEVTSN